MRHNAECISTSPPNSDSNTPKLACGIEEEKSKNFGDASEMEELQNWDGNGLIAVRAPCQKDVNDAPEISSTISSSQPKDPDLGTSSDWPGD